MPMMFSGPAGPVIRSSLFVRNWGVRSLAGWKLMVRNMVARGAHLTTRKIEPAAEYLAGLEPGDPTICE